MLKNPGFTAVAVLTLALGIRVNTTIFSVVNAVLLRPLPYRDPERLVRIVSVNPSLSLQDPRSSGLNVLDWQRQSTLFESIAAFQQWDGFLTHNGKSEPARVSCVTPNLMPMLGLKLLRGALLPDGEEPAPGLVLPHGLWQHRFGGDPSVSGKATLCQSRAAAGGRDGKPHDAPNRSAGMTGEPFGPPSARTLRGNYRPQS